MQQVSERVVRIVRFEARSLGGICRAVWFQDFDEPICGVIRVLPMPISLIIEIDNAAVEGPVLDRAIGIRLAVESPDGVVTKAFDLGAPELMYRRHGKKECENEGRL